MLYALYDSTAAALYPARLWARAASSMLRGMPGGEGLPEFMTWPTRAAMAWADVTDSVLRPRGKPAWNVRTARGSEEPVVEQVVLDLPFVRLLRTRRASCWWRR